MITGFISREEALFELKNNGGKLVKGMTPGLVLARSIILNLPAADVAAVQRGRWVKKDDGIICSVCKNGVPHGKNGGTWFSDFCPVCGAKMGPGGGK